MKEINITDLDFNDIQEISSTERHYGEFTIKLKLADDEWYELIHRTPYNKTTRLFSEQRTEKLVKKYGKPNQKLGYTYIHNPTLWEEPYEDDEW